MTFVSIHCHELRTEMFAERKAREKNQSNLRFYSLFSPAHTMITSKSNLVTQIITFSSKFQLTYPGKNPFLFTFSPLFPYYQIRNSDPRLRQPIYRSIDVKGMTMLILHELNRQFVPFSINLKEKE